MNVAFDGVAHICSGLTRRKQASLSLSGFRSRPEAALELRGRVLAHHSQVLGSAPATEGTEMRRRGRCADLSQHSVASSEAAAAATETG